MTDAQPLARYLHRDILLKLKVSSCSLQPSESGCLLRILQNKGSYLTVLTNGKSTTNIAR